MVALERDESEDGAQEAGHGCPGERRAKTALKKQGMVPPGESKAKTALEKQGIAVYLLYSEASPYKDRTSSNIYPTMVRIGFYLISTLSL